MKYIYIAISMILISGCSSMGQLGPDAKLTSKNKSIFVVGISPSNIAVIVRPGKIENSEFIHNGGPPATLVGNPSGGYIVGQASADSSHALVYFDIQEKGDMVTGELVICKGNKSIAFTAPSKGSVIYLGDLEFKIIGKTFSYNYVKNFEKAKEYIDTNFPNLKGLIKDFSKGLTPINTQCSDTYYMAI
jgi:hypothetical protein